ncbi:hypothetical protein ACGK9R_16600 [Halomonas sp. HNIBRBA4712]|uniref:hypothetical protein n=1 Tax=Halomonas sp. HNIBRBA4712 TaxID=3373087 RepID=UPI0037477D1F
MNLCDAEPDDRDSLLLYLLWSPFDANTVQIVNPINGTTYFFTTEEKLRRIIILKRCDYLTGDSGRRENGEIDFNGFETTLKAAPIVRPYIIHQL